MKNLNFSAFTCEDKVIALCHHLRIKIEYSDSGEAYGDQAQVDEITESHYDDSIFNYGNKEFAVYTAYEATEALDGHLDACIEDVVLPAIPEGYRPYFDAESFKSDTIRNDHRGCHLADYDGIENTEIVDGITYYIYRKS